jgi:pimeloyl-ACP methyl ester carboxylesterase
MAATASTPVVFVHGLRLHADSWGPWMDSPAVTDYREFSDRGHSLTIDKGWREVADSVLAWLKERGL